MRLLIVGVLDGHMGTAIKIARDRGAQVSQADGLEPALNVLRSGGGADLVMIDVRLNVKALVDAMQAERINTPVVACGIATDTAAAVQAIKAGAKEFIPLPPDPEMIAAVLEAVSEESHAMIFRDQRMAEVVRLADQVAPSEASILVTGESGTGKEIMARYVHRKSRRKDKPFIAVNCAAIPENLLESELFGHEKGAFTGAVARRLGKFEEANGGTLLLDEIGEMDMRLQAKLLRVLQEREIDRVGGAKPVKVDIRLIATTNRDLTAEVQKGTFREDLLFRLNVLHFKLPPLRERPNDLAALSEFFIKRYAEMNHMPEKPLSPEALQVIQGYHWPGNVRELENSMHRAVLLSGPDLIGPEAIMLSDGSRPTSPASQSAAQPAQPVSPMPHNPAGAAAAAYGNTAAGGYAPQAPTPATPGAAPGAADNMANTASMVGMTVAQVEQTLIIDTLQHCLGNRTHAANILGISIRTLRNKLRQYQDEGIPVPQPGEGARPGL